MFYYYLFLTVQHVKAHAYKIKCLLFFPFSINLVIFLPQSEVATQFIMIWQMDTVENCTDLAASLNTHTHTHAH